MARILICHVPKDGSTARELGSALMGRGHFVSFDGEPDTPRSDRSSRLRQFEAVVVIWTEVSAQSTGLAEIARETLPLNSLVPVRAEELDKTRLPLMFRKLNMLAPRDVDGIARLIARFSTAASSLREIAATPPRDEKAKASPETARAASEAPPKAGPAAAPTVRSRAPEPAPPAHPPAPPVVEAGAAARARPLFDLPEVTAPVAEARPPERVVAPAAPPYAAARTPAVVPHRPRRPAVTAADLSRAVDHGLLVWHIPDAMWLGEPITVEIVLGREVLAGLFPPDADLGGDPAADRQGIETLSLSLYGNADVFEIERQSERTQFVSPKEALAGRDPATFGRWAWLVTPQAAGTQDLVVRISALLRDRHGVPEPVALPDRRFQIVIDVPEGAGLVSGLMGWYRS